jgi:site-specific recombinase XerD
MELSVKEFLESVVNPNTRKGYRVGIKKFYEWFGKSPREILEARKDDLTQRSGEDLIEYRNRAARFEREIEKFHGYLLNQGYTTNTARGMTIGIRQLFRYYQMPIRMRAGSRVTKTVKTSRNFPLRIEHVRKMSEVADLRERVVLSMATDLGLRISNFVKIKKNELPLLDDEPPLMFDVMTGKEEVVAHGFLSAETVELLKVYLPTLQKKDNPYLFPSNSERPISDEWLNQLLEKLVEKAQIDLNGKSLTFHCFRKMFLSGSIDSGIGLTAGKKLCGKAIAQSDDTYLTTVKLREKFAQLKKFLAIKQSVKIEGQQLEKLGSLVAKLAEELEQQKLVVQAVTGENLKIRREFKERVAELNEEIAVSRLVGEQVAEIGEGVKRWQEEKGEIEAKIAGIENFQKLILNQPDEVILELIKDVKRQLKEQRG